MSRFNIFSRKEKSTGTEMTVNRAGGEAYVPAGNTAWPAC
jgi:hypothetical protein